MAGLKIVKVEAASPEEWDSITDHCSHSIFYHTRLWAELWEVQTKGKVKPSAKLLTFNDGVKVLLPMSRYKVAKGLMDQFVATPPGWTPGGWLGSQALTPEHHRAVWNYCTRLNLFIRQNPYDPSLSAVSLPWMEGYGNVIQVLDLRVGYETVERGWHKRQATPVSKARRNGIVVEEATDLEDWKAFYRAYEDSQDRWQTIVGPEYEWSFFEHIFNLKSPKIKLWVAKHEGNVTCGILCFYQSKHVIYYYGAAFREYFNLRPVNLLHCEVVRQACEEGYWWYDMGGTNFEKVAAFKASFGTRNIWLGGTVHRGITRRFVDNAKNVISQQKKVFKQSGVPHSQT